MKEQPASALAAAETYLPPSETTEEARHGLFAPGRASSVSREAMSDRNERVRVLYSFPLRLGADRICTTAWQQVNGLAAAGADVLVFPASLSRPVAPGVRVSPTLARGKFRLPYRVVGTMRAVLCTTRIVARRIRETGGTD